MYEFALYIVGNNRKSQEISDALQQWLADDFPRPYQLKVVDVLERPDLAEKDNILVTPSLLKKKPPPELKILGNLADKNIVCEFLGVTPKPRPA